MTRTRIAVSLLLAAALASCANWWFSSANPPPDRSQPVARIELRGQPAQLGATTSEGVLFLNKDGARGACRVHYFLGPDLLVEDGTVRDFGGGFAIADIELKTQAVPILARDLLPADELVALVLSGDTVRRVPVRLASTPGASGDVLDWPGVPLPFGTGIFRVRTGRHAGELQFVGLAKGLATLRTGETSRRFITFAGPARLREALATPRPLFTPHRVTHRPDGISVRKE